MVEEVETEDWAFRLLGPEHGIRAVKAYDEIPDFPVKLLSHAPHGGRFVACGATGFVVGKVSELAHALRSNKEPKFESTVEHPGILLVEVLANELQAAVYDDASNLTLYSISGSPQKTWEKHIEGITGLFAGLNGDVAYTTSEGAFSVATESKLGGPGAFAWSTEDSSKAVTDSSADYLGFIGPKKLRIAGEEASLAGQNIDDMCPPFGDDQRHVAWYVSTVSDLHWVDSEPGVFVCVAAQSSDVFLGSTKHALLIDDDAARAVMPLIGDSDASPVGAFLDVTVSEPTPEPFPGIEKGPPSPLLVVLTNAGTLVAWNLASRQAKQLPSKPKISATNLLEPKQSQEATAKTDLEEEPEIIKKPEMEPTEAKTSIGPEKSEPTETGKRSEQPESTEKAAKDPSNEPSNESTDTKKPTDIAGIKTASDAKESASPSPKPETKESEAKETTKEPTEPTKETKSPAKEPAKPSPFAVGKSFTSTWGSNNTGSAFGGNFGSGVPSLSSTFGSSSAFGTPQGSNSGFNQGAGAFNLSSNTAFNNASGQKESPFAKFAQSGTTGSESTGFSKFGQTQSPFSQATSSPAGGGGFAGFSKGGSLFSQVPSKGGPGSAQPSLFGSSNKPSVFGTPSKPLTLDSEKTPKSPFAHLQPLKPNETQQTGQQAESKPTEPFQSKKPDTGLSFGNLNLGEKAVPTSPFAHLQPSKPTDSEQSKPQTGHESNEQLQSKKPETGPSFGTSSLGKEENSGKSSLSLGNLSLPEDEPTTSEVTESKRQAPEPTQKVASTEHIPKEEPQQEPSFDESDTTEESELESELKSEPEPEPEPRPQSTPKAESGSASNVEPDPISLPDNKAETSAATASAIKPQETQVVSTGPPQGLGETQWSGPLEVQLPFEVPNGPEYNFKSELDVIYTETCGLFRVLDHNLRLLEESQHESTLSESTATLGRHIADVGVQVASHTQQLKPVLDDFQKLPASTTATVQSLQRLGELLDAITTELENDDAYELRTMPVRSAQVRLELRHQLATVNKLMRDAEADLVVARARRHRGSLRLADLSMAVDAVSQRLHSAIAKINSVASRLPLAVPSSATKSGTGSLMATDQETFAERMWSHAAAVSLVEQLARLKNPI